MHSKFHHLAAVAAMIVAGSVHSASANETDLQFGPDPLALCAKAAAQAGAADSASDKALSVCNQAVERAKSLRDELSAAYVNRSVVHLARHEYDAALADSDMSIRVKRTVAQAFVNRGIALHALGRSKEAVVAYTQAIELSPSRPQDVYFDRAMAKEDAGDVKGAYLDYRKAAQLDPSWEAPRKEMARFTVGTPPVG